MTFTASDVLLKAASRIEEEGMWCQQAFYHLTVREIDDLTRVGRVASLVDLAKAIRSAGLRVPECAQGAIYSTALELGVPELARLAADRLREDIGWPIGRFNDARGRTAHQVAEAMRRAAVE